MSGLKAYRWCLCQGLRPIGGASGGALRPIGGACGGALRPIGGACVRA